MMGYKDQTWCTRYSSGECINSLCWLALTKKDKREGKRWWGSEDFPVSIGDMKTDGCGFVTGVEE